MSERQKIELSVQKVIAESKCPEYAIEVAFKTLLALLEMREQMTE